MASSCVTFIFVALWMNGRLGQNSVVYNHSNRTFYTCADKCTSALKTWQFLSFWGWWRQIDNMWNQHSCTVGYVILLDPASVVNIMNILDPQNHNIYYNFSHNVLTTIIFFSRKHRLSFSTFLKLLLMDFFKFLVFIKSLSIPPLNQAKCYWHSVEISASATHHCYVVLWVNLQYDQHTPQWRQQSDLPLCEIVLSFSLPRPCFLPGDIVSQRGPQWHNGYANSNGWWNQGIVTLPVIGGHKKCVDSWSKEHHPLST